MKKYLPNQHELRQAVFTAIAILVLAGILSFAGGLVRHAFWSNRYGGDFGGRDYKQNSMRGHMMPDGSYMDMPGGDESMDSMMMEMSDSLQGLKGDDLDKEFLMQMIVHHEGAIDMAKILKEGTKRPELQKMADDIINVQTKEVQMMENWLDTWFPVKK